ncbi:hypothetical protein KKC88_04190 [Patescibacteria group bacterium]|nr:hypothetical protein [Patescibacteria group bacterium]MBU1673169.1 hypothetical protein [Patescibacteria group bacterium]MBU1964146.1 hypothetical protein [Patescibacteria group bacterium]
MKILNSVKNLKFRKKKLFPMVLFGLVFGLFLITPQITGAETTADVVQSAQNLFSGDKRLDNIVQWTLNIISWFIYYVIIYPNGYLSGIMIDMIVSVAGWSKFTTLPAIEQAWEVVLNLTNMVFIIFLLVIAFATVFKIEAYSYKKLLPLLVIVAILVNFSKVICGVLIDASQIVMLAFLDPIKDTALQNLTQVFQLNYLFEFQGGAIDDLFKDSKDPSAEYLLAILVVAAMMAVMVIVLFVYLIVFLGRIAIFWIATVLSPIAFVCAVLPATKKYFSEWAETFARYLIIGPLAMFFLWLAMFIVSGSYDSGGITQAIEANAEISDLTGKAPTSISKALNASTIANFIIATMLLMKGMEMAQKMASEFGEYIGKAKGLGEWFAKGGLGREIMNRAIKPAVGFASRGISRGASAVGRTVGRGAMTGGKYAGDLALDSLYERTGVDLNLKRVWEKMKSESGDIKRERELTGRSKARKYAESGDLRGWLGASDYMYRQYLPLLGEQQRHGLDPGAQFRRMTDDNPAFKGAKAEYEKLRGNRGVLNDRKARLRAGFEQDYITDEAFLQKQGIMQNMKDVEDALNKGDFSSTDDNSKGMLQNYMAQLEGAGDAAGVNGVKNVLNGTSDVSSIKDGFEGFLRSQRGEIAGEIAGAERMPKDEYDQAWNNALTQDGVGADIKTNNAALATAKETMGKFAPVIDYAAVQAQRAFMDNEMKKISTDNEDDLISQLKSKINAGDQTGTLAVMLQASKVGHSNEMPNALGLDANPENLRLIFESLINDEDSQKWAAQSGNTLLEHGPDGVLGGLKPIDRQLAMSVADDYSRNAKAINHWWCAEMVTNENGQFRFRDQAEQEGRKYAEMDKAGIGNVLAKGNRLAFGDYYTDKSGPEPLQRWKFNSSGLSAFSNSVGAGMSKSMKDKRLNESLVQHIVSNPAEWKKLEAAVAEQIKARPLQKDEIKKCMDELKGYVAKSGTQGFDPGAVTAKHSRIINSI